MSQANATTTCEWTLGHSIYTGQTWHIRHKPRVYKFNYPYRMLGLWLSRLDELDNHFWFSMRDERKHAVSMSRFLSKDHNHVFDDIDTPQTVNAQNHGKLEAAIKHKLCELTGEAVTGDVLAVTNTRTLGFYFSPVNFFIGFDAKAKPSHLLAEVSNTPWGETYLYGFLLDGEHTEYSHDKSFKVSPFNDVAGEQYHWRVDAMPDNLRINIGLTDVRGRVFDAGIHLSPQPLTKANMRREILKNPMMNTTSIARIYWQAFKLYFLKKIPYVPYDKDVL